MLVAFACRSNAHYRTFLPQNMSFGLRRPAEPLKLKFVEILRCMFLYDFNFKDTLFSNTQYLIKYLLKIKLIRQDETKMITYIIITS